MSDAVRIVVDTKSFPRVHKALKQVGGKAPAILARGLNKVGDKSRTQIKGLLRDQTGIPANKVAKRFKTIRAGRNTLTYKLIVEDRWQSITESTFGAKKFSYGVRHKAWQMFSRKGGRAKGAFLVKGVAMTRKTGARYPLKPLYGSNVARELIRNRKEHEKVVNKMLATEFEPKVMHEIDRELKKAKAQYQL